VNLSGGFGGRNTTTASDARRRSMFAGDYRYSLELTPDSPSVLTLLRQHFRTLILVVPGDGGVRPPLCNSDQRTLSFWEAFPTTLVPLREGIEMRSVKIIVENHEDGYVAYPLGLKGVVVGEGDTYQETLDDVKSAIEFHAESFGDQVLLGEPVVLEAFMAETAVAI